MFGITMARLRAHPRRLVLTTVVVVLSVGFTAGTLILADSLNQAASLQEMPDAKHLEVPLLMLGAVALIVAAFVIANTFRILVAQRTRELALLRTVGATRRQVRTGVLVEAAVVGALGSAAGLALGAVSAAGIGRALSADHGSMPLVVSASTVVASMLVGMLVTVGSAVAPAAAATRVAPLAAVRAVPDGVDSPGARRRQTSVGLTLIAVGVAGLGLGVSVGLGAGIVVVVFAAAVCFLGILLLGPRIVPPMLRITGALAGRAAGRGRSTVELATANSVRHPRRAAATSAALMIGVTMVIGFVTVAESARASVGVVLDARVPADFVLSPVEPGGLSDEAIRAVDDLPETGASVELYTAIVDTGEVGTVEVLGTDLQRWAQIAQLDGDGNIADIAAGDVAIDGGTADEFGLGVGDTVTVFGQELPIGYIVDTRTMYHTGLVLAPATFRALAPEAASGPEYFAVDTADGVSPSRAHAAIEETLQAWPDIMLRNHVEAKERLNRGLDQTVSVVVAILGVAVIIAVIGIANTLSLSVHERRREIGVLRAVGLTKAQTMRLLGVEAVLTALVGALTGVTVGVGFAYAAVLSMERMIFVVPWGYVALTFVVAGALGAVAALGPARRAARMSPVVALATE